MIIISWLLLFVCLFSAPAYYWLVMVLIGVGALGARIIFMDYKTTYDVVPVTALNKYSTFLSVTSLGLVKAGMINGSIPSQKFGKVLRVKSVTTKETHHGTGE